MAARARGRGAVLLVTEHSPGADVELRVDSGHWVGAGHDGHGWLRSRSVRVHATVRGAARRLRETSVLLPGPDGRVGANAQGEQRRPAVTAPRPRTRRAG